MPSPDEPVPPPPTDCSSAVEPPTPVACRPGNGAALAAAVPPSTMEATLKPSSTYCTPGLRYSIQGMRGVAPLNALSRTSPVAKMKH
jgi:hypothetical protein